MKFALYIDYKTKNNQSRYEYKVLEAKTLEEAIAEAENEWNDTIYLAQIMKKVGKIEKVESNIKQETFEAILCKRSNGWHLNDTKNGESKHFAHRVFTKDWDYFKAFTPDYDYEF